MDTQELFNFGVTLMRAQVMRVSHENICPTCKQEFMCLSNHIDEYCSDECRPLPECDECDEPYPGACPEHS